MSIRWIILCLILAPSSHAQSILFSNTHRANPDLVGDYRAAITDLSRAPTLIELASIVSAGRLCLAMASSTASGQTAGGGSIKYMGAEIDYWQREVTDFVPCISWRFSLVRPITGGTLIGKSVCSIYSGEDLCDDTWGYPAANPLDEANCIRQMHSTAAYNDTWGLYAPNDDPCVDASNHSIGAGIDFVEMCAGHTASGGRPDYNAEYYDGGTGNGITDPYFRVNALDASCRADDVARVLAVIADYGIAPGETAVLVLTNKPPWNRYQGNEDLYGESGNVNTDGCAREESDRTGDGVSRSTYGYFTPNDDCNEALANAPSRPNPSSWGPGEYETANALWIEDLIAALNAAGYDVGSGSRCFASGTLSFIGWGNPRLPVEAGWVKKGGWLGTRLGYLTCGSAGSEDYATNYNTDANSPIAVADTQAGLAAGLWGTTVAGASLDVTSAGSDARGGDTSINTCEWVVDDTAQTVLSSTCGAVTLTIPTVGEQRIKLEVCDTDGCDADYLMVNRTS